jgi:hypothetical protein
MEERGVDVKTGLGETFNNRMGGRGINWSGSGGLS